LPCRLLGICRTARHLAGQWRTAPVLHVNILRLNVIRFARDDALLAGSVAGYLSVNGIRRWLSELV